MMSNPNAASEFSQFSTTTSVEFDPSVPGHPAYKIVGPEELRAVDSGIKHPEDTGQLLDPVHQEPMWRCVPSESTKRRAPHQPQTHANAEAAGRESQDREPAKKISRRSKTSHRNLITVNEAADGADLDGSDLESESPHPSLPEHPDAMKSRLEQDGVHPSRMGRFIHISDDNWSVDPSIDSMFPLLVMMHVNNCKHSYQFACFAVRISYSRFHA
jgi:hypothetical protein